MFLLLAFFSIASPVFAQEASPSVFTKLIAVPATDLRKEPTSAKGNILEHDPLEESQLLYGEKVRFIEQKGDWSRVQAIEQIEWTHHKKWEGYPGWVLSSHLSPIPSGGWEPNAVITAPMAEVRQEQSSNSPILLSLFIGTKVVMQEKKQTPPHPSPLPLWGRGRLWRTSLKAGLGEGDQWRPILLVDGRAGWIRKDQIASLESLRQLPLSQLRQRVISTARTFLGKPYFWGGLSVGVDCSGLVLLAHRANGIDLPRDAHEQFMRSQPIQRTQLQPADLIFFSSEEDPHRISHVMLYAGDGKIIEGPGTGKFVEQKPLDEKLNQNQDRKVYFASVLK